MQDEATDRPGPDDGKRPYGNIVEAAVGVIVQPNHTLASLTYDAKVGWALTVAALVAALSTVASVAGRGFERPAGQTPAILDEISPGLMIAAALGGPVIGIVLTAIWSAFVHLASLLLGGKGSYSAVFSGIAFSNVPSLFGVPLQLLPLALGGAGSMLAGALRFGLFAWVVVLGVVAIRHAHAFTTGRAVAAILIPIAAVFVIVFALVVVIVALIVGNFSPGGPQP